MSDYLDLVALGTVADVVSLDYNNRILVYEGIRRIRGGQARPGIMALIQVSNRVAERLQSADLGFSIGPRLNAAGRLKDMSLGIECLVTSDSNKARELAEQLGNLNTERREIEAKMKQEAEKDLSAMVNRDEDLPFGLCMYDANWHQGVIGILASRIKDQVYRPVIAFAKETDEPDSPLKGSARSVTGFHIRDALANIDAMNPGMLNKFGGHAMAAGLTMARDQFEAFQKAFDAEVRKVLSTGDLLGVIYSDGEITSEQLNLEFAKLLQDAGPWGQGFAEPVFDGVFEIVDQRIVGEKHLKLKFRPLDSPDLIDGIFFNIGQLQDHRRVRVTYQLSVNEFRGRESLQFIVSTMESAD
jgi:single-stranded-DNA-specific exonuclease